MNRRSKPASAIVRNLDRAASSRLHATQTGGNARRIHIADAGYWLRLARAIRVRSEVAL